MKDKAIPTMAAPLKILLKYSSFSPKKELFYINEEIAKISK